MGGIWHRREQNRSWWFRLFCHHNHNHNHNHNDYDNANDDDDPDQRSISQNDGLSSPERQQQAYQQFCLYYRAQYTNCTTLQLRKTLETWVSINAPLPLLLLLVVPQGSRSPELENLLDKLKQLRSEARKVHGVDLFAAFLAGTGANIEAAVGSEDDAIDKVRGGHGACSSAPCIVRPHYIFCR